MEQLDYSMQRIDLDFHANGMDHELNRMLENQRISEQMEDKFRHYATGNTVVEEDAEDEDSRTITKKRPRKKSGSKRKDKKLQVEVRAFGEKQRHQRQFSSKGKNSKSPMGRAPGRTQYPQVFIGDQGNLVVDVRKSDSPIEFDV